MKVLFYNWVDYLDPEGRGGGVTVYQKNLIEAFANRSDVDAWFIASGISYDLSQDTPRWERVKHGGRKYRNRRFEIINSGVLSPGHHSYGQNAQVEHPGTVEAFYDFMRKNGPFDVVHFHNLEGLPGSVLALKDEFPDTKVLFSLHNYYPLCPQVNLWYKERENCLDYQDGKNCEQCLVHHVNPWEVRHANAAAYALKKNGVAPGAPGFGRLFGQTFKWANRFSRVRARFGSKEARKALAFPQDKPLSPPTGSKLLTQLNSNHVRFKERRERIVATMNESVDKVLCVSDRVGEVAAKFGIDETLIETLYIGTKQAPMFEETSPKPSLVKEDGTLTLGYLGYMRRDKGFYFLLEALETMPRDLAKRINAVICARRADDATMHRLGRVGDRLNSVHWADGYKHDQLDDLLSEVDVGVVPVLWEDNLPQVAIEMHARHIPLLTSNLGGAKELGNFPPMVFEAGDVRAFHARLRAILDGEITSDDYWQNAMAPVSMSDHVEQLLNVYRDLLGEEDPDEGTSDEAGEADAPDALEQPAPDLRQSA